MGISAVSPSSSTEGFSSESLPSVSSFFEKAEDVFERNSLSKKDEEGKIKSYLVEDLSRNGEVKKSHGSLFIWRI